MSNSYKEYASKDYVLGQIASAGHLKREIVTELPDAMFADPNTIYMIKVSDIGDDDYKEYMLIGSVMTQIGDTSVNLNGYVMSADLPGLVKELPAKEAYESQWAEFAVNDDMGRPFIGTYATKEDLEGIGVLPTVTTANNGQFLQVVNGAWAAATIPSAEGVTFGE